MKQKRLEHGRRGWLQWRSELRRTLVLALPIMAGMLSHMLVGLADTVMVGRVGVVPLAAAALVNLIVHLPMVVGLGLLAAVQILASQAYGARERVEAGEALRHGLWIALAAGLVTGGLMTVTGPYLGWLGQPEEVVSAAQVYLRYFAWSMVPMLLAHGIKQFCESLNDAWMPMAILMSGVVVNVFLNWVFIFGHLGAPAMGLDGAGLATLLARVMVLGVMLVHLFRSESTRAWLPAGWLAPISWGRIRGQVRLGGPVAAQHLMENGAFAVGGLMMGWLGASAMAAHQVALSCAATTFMFALGVGMAVSIRVGHAWGAGLYGRVRRITYGGVLLGAGAMGLFALAFLLAGRTIAGWFVADPEVLRLATLLLVVAGFFQLADGTQVVMISALRGMSDVRVPALCAGVSYWIIALPTAYLLGFTFEYGAPGIWTGLAFGLAAAAAGLSWRFRVRVRECARAGDCRALGAIGRADQSSPTTSARIVELPAK